MQAKIKRKEKTRIKEKRCSKIYACVSQSRHSLVQLFDILVAGRKPHREGSLQRVFDKVSTEYSVVVVPHFLIIIPFYMNLRRKCHRCLNAPFRSNDIFASI